MRTISAIALCLMLVFATTGCAASKIAVVDPARLFQESEPGKAGIEHLKQLEAAMQEQLKTAQGMIEKAPNDVVPAVAHGGVGGAGRLGAHPRFLGG